MGNLYPTLQLTTITKLKLQYDIFNFFFCHFHQPKTKIQWQNGKKNKQGGKIEKR